MPYRINPDEWILLEDFARKYSFYYLNGNDTNTIIGSTQMFREITSLFD